MKNVWIELVSCMRLTIFSDHDPILLELSLDMQYVASAANVYTRRASGKRANNFDLFNYRSALSRNLANFDLDIEVLTCHNVNCNISVLAVYARVITDVCLDACKNAIPCTTVKQKKVVVLPGGQNMFKHYAISLSSGIICGLTTAPFSSCG